LPPTQQPLMEIQGLCKTYSQARWWWRQSQFGVRALQDVDLVLKTGTTLALVGESGSGKTTLAMCLVGLEQPDAGDVRFEGKSVLGLGRRKRMAALQNIQLIFQDSAGALNPFMSAAEIIEEPLRIRGHEHKKERAERSVEAMEQVGLSLRWKDRRPSELSGGQRQRLAIARGLVLKPRLLILDEAVSGLDLSIQGQIMNLLLDLQAAQGLSYLYISHNLDVVSRISDEVAIIHEGRIVEHGRPSEVLASAQHTYPQVPWPAILTQKSACRAHSGA
jgi:ABC-type glutathione transport system ATPase component